MVVTDIGKNRIRDLIVADVSSGALGIGTTSPSINDTALENEIATTSKTVTINSTNKSFTVTHVIDTTVANGEALTEFGLKVNGDGVLLNRLVFPPINKTSAFELTTIVTYKVV